MREAVEEKEKEITDLKSIIEMYRNPTGYAKVITSASEDPLV